MRATLDHITKETDRIWTFWFEPEFRLRFSPGQFTELTIPHEQPDDRGTWRQFTISSTPDEPLIGITTTFTRRQSSSFKRALRALEPGAHVSLSEPMGDFVLPKDPSIPLVFVASGIGITPFLSMFKWLSARKEERSIRFIHGIRTEDDIIFQDVLSKAHQHATIVVRKPSAAWGGEHGRPSAPLILGLSEPPADALLYLAGPEDLIQELSSDLQAAGIDSSRIVTDLYRGYER